MIQNLIFSLQTVAPVFLIILLGILIKQKKWVNDDFISMSTRLVFNIAVPCLVFLKIAQTDFRQVFNGALIAFALISILVLVGITWAAALFFIKDGRALGAFIQGAYRSNFAIIGLAVAYNMMGDQGMARAAILLSFTLPLYNVLAVIVLTIPAKKEGGVPVRKIALDIMKNPLIMAAVLALVFSIFRIPLHQIFECTARYLADVTLPLALIGIGGSLTLTSVKSRFCEAGAATFIKLVAGPVLFPLVGYKLGFAGQDVAVLFILFGCPTAIASFIMAKAMDCDGELAANIVVMSTLASMVTLSVGVFVLKTAGII